MNPTGYEPTDTEIRLTLGLGMTVLSPYYKAFVDSLNLYGHERVLDFGSGSGVCSRHIAARLQKDGGHLDCVDISSAWTRVSRRTLRRFRNVSLHHGDIDSLWLPDDSYDAIVVHFVLHDIPRPERGRIVAALVNKLKPAGRLLMREPVGRGLEIRELRSLAERSNLHVASLLEHKVAIGEVYDGNFIDIQPPREAVKDRVPASLMTSFAV